MNKIEKILVIGLDAAIPKRLYDFAMAGKLPTIQKLINGGVFAENCLAPLPTHTGSNWTTISTGAWPGTHGQTVSNQLPGDAIDSRSELRCQAEYIWNAAERDGKKTIIVNYPQTLPITMKEGYQLGGRSHYIGNFINRYQIVTTKDLPMANRVQLTEVKDWKNLPSLKRARETTLRIRYRGRAESGPPGPGRPRESEKLWHLLALDFGNGYEQVIFSEEKDAAKAFLSLKVGEWSKTVVQDFETNEGSIQAGFKAKLLEVDQDLLSIYMTPLCSFSFPSYPESLASEVVEHVGLPISAGDFGGFMAMRTGWVDSKTGVEIVDLENKWLGDAVAYLLENKEWTLFFMHAHAIDALYHMFAKDIDPLTAKNEVDVKRCQEIELDTYKSLDRMIAKILSSVTDKALVILTSDHGGKADLQRYCVVDALVNAGLTVYKEEKDVGRRRRRGWPGGNRAPVDWSKTKASIGECVHIYVNLKGREPHGIVEPEDYENVRDEIIKTLFDYTDSATGKKPIALALRREDARVIGLYGERVGDIVYAYASEFGGVHGEVLSTAEHGIGSVKGLFTMTGPDVKEGVTLKRTVNLTDIVPTICYLADLPIPKEAEGSIIYQAFKDPDLKLNERRNLEEKYKKVVEAHDALQGEFRWQS